MVVYILEYTHKYGTDISVYTTAGMALDAQFELMRHWASDLLHFLSLEQVQAFKKRLDEKDSSTAREWENLTGECFQVYSRVVNRPAVVGDSFEERQECCPACTGDNLKPVQANRVVCTDCEHSWYEGK